MEKSTHSLRIIAAVFTLVMALGIGGFMITEGMSFADALYFSVVTVTTVGYGDITPKSGAGRILAMLIIILGVGTFSAVVARMMYAPTRSRMEESLGSSSVKYSS